MAKIRRHFIIALPCDRGYSLKKKRGLTSPANARKARSTKREGLDMMRFIQKTTIKTTIVAACAGVLFASAGAAAQTACTRNVDRDELLNVRPTPGVFRRPTAQIRGGSCNIQVQSCSNGWCRVSYRGVSGFVSGFYLQPQRAQNWNDDEVAREIKQNKRNEVIERLRSDPNWRRLGAIDIERGRSRYFVQMDRDDGRFDAFRLRLFGGPLELNRFGVIYGNGKRDDLAVERRMSRGSVSKRYDLAGESGRFLDRLELDFQTIPGRGRLGQIEIWARKFDPKAQAKVASFGSDWVKLGEKEVQRQTERDRVVLSRRDGQFERLGVIARRNDVRIYDMLVRYGNGGVQRLSADARLRKGQKSPAIDLAGANGRFISEVEFRYETITSGPKAIVELWGKPPKIQTFGPGWVKLGERRVSRTPERDTLNFSRPDRRLAAIGVIARRNDVRVYDISVRYGNGQIERLTGDVRLRQDQRSRALDLTGSNGRFVSGIGLAYETITKGPDATIEVWGKLQ